jgi:trigger factor
MQVTETLSDGLKRGYTVLVPAADIESRRAKRLAELGRTLRLPGFRPGRVPVTVVKQRYGNSVNAEVLEQSVSEATKQVLTDRGLRSAGQPRVELVALPDARDLEFKVELELLPEITLPDLSALTLTRLKAEPTPDAIDTALQQLAQRQRTLEPLEPRAAEPGEVLVVDFAGKIDGVAFKGGAGTDVEVELGGSGLVPGFAEQLAGLAPGETRQIEVTFPADYGAKDVAGKTARFEVTAKALKRVVVPAADDALAHKLGFEDGLEEMRKVLASRIQREYDQMARLHLKRELFDALAAHADFPVPQGMVDAEFNGIWQRLEQDRKEGRDDEEDRGKDEMTLRAEYRAISERRVRLGLLLAEIGRLNAVTVSDAEMSRAARAQAMRFPGQERQVLEMFAKNPQAAEQLHAPLFEEKVVDFMLEAAQVTERQVTVEELERDPELPAEVQAAGRAAADGAAEQVPPVPEVEAAPAQALAGQTAEEAG